MNGGPKTVNFLTSLSIWPFCTHLRTLGLSYPKCSHKFLSLQDLSKISLSGHPVVPINSALIRYLTHGLLTISLCRISDISLVFEKTKDFNSWTGNRIRPRPEFVLIPGPSFWPIYIPLTTNRISSYTITFSHYEHLEPFMVLIEYSTAPSWEDFESMPRILLESTLWNYCSHSPTAQNQYIYMCLTNSNQM